ncbi:MAG: GNAT family N-acetyltransferase [Acidobacteriaceae bacterium]
MTLELREFRPGDETVFRELNEAWIAAYFQIEAKDREVLNDPQTYILDRGGHIYFAVNAETDEALGCCALLAMEPGVFEVAKMTVSEKWRGHRIGRKLLRGTIDAARALGATRLYLETNHTLTNAIELYCSEGFQHFRPEDTQPSRYARADVFMERLL